jgi:hypothetical protein
MIDQHKYSYLRAIKKVLIAGGMLACMEASLAMTGEGLLTLIKGDESQKLMASAYISGVVDALTERDFCRPPGDFDSQLLFGPIEMRSKRKSYFSFFSYQLGSWLVREVMIDLSPCEWKQKKCICRE